MSGDISFYSENTSDHHWSDSLVGLDVHSYV